MSNSSRKPARATPASADPAGARPKSPYDAPGREPDPTEFNLQILKRMDELARQIAEARGIPFEDVIGPRRWYRRSDPTKRKLTRDERLAREEAARAFLRLKRESSKLQ